MKVECPRANTHPTGSASRWTATGEFNESRRGLRRAELRCEVCGYYWSSGLPEAIAAGENAASDPELQPAPALPPGVYVPQPSLPMQKTRGEDFVTPKQLAQAVQYSHLLDVKRRASGDE